jgi:beta-1,4-mannosyltransferase
MATGMDAAQELTTGNARNSERPLVVGTWPGRSFSNNDFARVFAEALMAEGCRVVDVQDLTSVPEKLDILHVHWPEMMFWKGGGGGRLAKALYIFRALRAVRRMKRAGTRVVWMVHNLHPHDLKGYRRAAWPFIERFMYRHSDGFMTLAPSTIDVVRRAHPALAPRPAAAALHPVYPRIADLPDRASCRADLSLPDGTTVFALLGHLRPYKGAEALISAFRQDSDPNHRLLIAGRPITPDYGAQVAALAAADSRIIVRLGLLDEREFATCLGAVDFVILPYHSSLHSGALVHALSYGRVVLTPTAPFAEDVAEAVGAGWVICYPDGLSLALFEGRTMPVAQPDLSAMQPRQLGRVAAAFYRALAECPGVG